jgi:hypothetical protein
MPGDARRSRLAAWALAVALFAAGVAAGVAVDRLLVTGTPRPGRPGPPTSAELVARMTRDLELTGAQAGAIRAILDERWEALSTLSARFEPEAEEIRRAADDRIRATLDPGQRERFEQRVAERERRRAEVRARLGRAP